jgi:hypothetical protein
MAWNKFLGAFKNRKQILEGLKNQIFKKEHVEAEAARRWAICKECPSLDTQGSKCMAPGTQPCCSECGCSLSLKTRSLSSSCPLEKWLAVMDEDTEEKLREQLNK